MSFKQRKISVHIGIGISIFVMLIGLFSIFYPFIMTGLSTKEDIAFGVIPVSLGFALFALCQSFSSDLKMDINSNENFLRIVGRLEDMRMNLFMEIRYDHSYRNLIRYCWKLLTYMERAINLNEMANIVQDNQKKLYNQIVQLVYMSDLPWGRRRRIRTTDANGNPDTALEYIMREKDVNNILNVCLLCQELKLTQFQFEKVEEIIGYVGHFRSYY